MALDKPETARRDARKRIFLVDEHSLFRRGLARLLEEDPELTVCGESDTPTGASVAIEQTHADLLIVGMPIRDTAYTDLVRQVRKQHSNLPILVMSDSRWFHGGEKKNWLKPGGFVSKQEDADAVLAAIRKLFSEEAGADRSSDA